MTTRNDLFLSKKILDTKNFRLIFHPFHLFQGLYKFTGSSLPIPRIWWCSSLRPSKPPWILKPFFLSTLRKILDPFWIPPLLKNHRQRLLRAKHPQILIATLANLGETTFSFKGVICNHTHRHPCGQFQRKHLSPLFPPLPSAKENVGFWSTQNSPFSASHTCISPVISPSLPSFNVYLLTKYQKFN